MRKLMFTFACLAIFGTATVSAQVSESDKELITDKIEEGFSEMETSKLPKSIKNDVQEGFSKAELKNVYKNKKGQYMLVFLDDESNSSKVVYANTRRGILSR